MPAMKLPVIRLIDLGFDDGFGKSMNFAQSLIESINVSGQRAEIEYVRTTDMNLVARALTVPARLIHIMAHGMKPEDANHAPSFGAVDADGYAIPGRTLGLDFLAQFLQEHGEGIEATAVFADCCNSSQRKFTTALRNSLETKIVYIGSTRTVDWHECTTFDSILYGSLLRAKGRGFEASDWVWNAALYSIAGYEKAVQGQCPFKLEELVPSRSAVKAFANAKRGRGLV